MQQHPQKYEFAAAPASRPAPEQKLRWQGAPMLRFGTPGPAPESPAPGEAEEALVGRLRELFERRPVWQRSALDENLEPGEKVAPWKVSAAIRQVAFFFLDGPWRNAYVRFGFDPRKEPEARIFQMLDFRDPFFRTGAAAGGEVDCHFRVPPVNRSQQYQLCDIDDSAIQSLLKGSKAQPVCTDSAGWLTVDQLDSIRNQLKVKSEAMRRGRLQVGK